LNSCPNQKEQIHKIKVKAKTEQKKGKGVRVLRRKNEFEG
jgi:hypothetical protein